MNRDSKLRLLSKVWLYVVFNILLVEISLRFSRIEILAYPNVNSTPEAFSPPYQPDSEIGWVNKPGAIQHKVRRNGRLELRQYTIRSDGSRVTANNETSSPNSIVLLGCSFTNGGVYLNDSDTFAWLLQQYTQDFRIFNFGTGAFSTFQSLLLYRRIAAVTKPSLVIYNLVSFHDSRNVADWYWLKALTDQTTGEVVLPYAVQNNSSVVEHAPTSYTRFNFARYLKVVRLCEVLYNIWNQGGRLSESRKTTLGVLKKLQSEVRANGANFIVVYLHAHGEASQVYPNQLQAADIPYVDCTVPTGMFDQVALPEDGHPNELVNQYWSECISRKLNATAVLAAR